MSEHLTEQQVERFRHERLSPEELLAIDAHTSACRGCANRIGDTERVRASLELWRSDFEAAEMEPRGHISYEQLAAYVDNADEAEREIVESHVKSCARCSMELDDLIRFSAQFAPQSEPLKIEKPETRSPKFFERFFAFWRGPNWWTALQLAGSAAAIILCVWFFISFRRENAELKAQLAEAQQERQAIQREYDDASAAIDNLQSQIAELQQSYLQNTNPTGENQTLVALKDGEGEVTLDRAGNLTGLKTLAPLYQQMVKTSLITERIQTPSTISNLIGRAGALMGGRGEGIAFSLLSPVGTAVLTDRPAFRWGAVEGATSYLVAVYDSNFNWVATSQPITATTWSAASPLRRGETYFWQVTAIKDGKEIKSPVPPAPEAKFRVLEQAKADEMSQIKKTASNSHLAAGLIYAKEGLLDDAQREFETLAHANPKSMVAQKLLGSVKAIRQAKR